MPANGRWPYCTPQWQAVRLLVLARDGYACTRLSIKHSRILDVDHVIEWTKRPDLAFDPTNLRTLCRLHHNRKTHGKPRRRRSRRW
jgi:5-methylcytosine-specific restriction protein A